MVTILVLGIAVALAPVSVASASHSHHSTKHKTHKTTQTTKAGLVPGGSVCTFLDNQGGSAKISSAIGSAVQSGNFASAQQTLLKLFSEIAKDAPAAEAALRSAPGNVQAAFKAMIGYDAQFKTAIASATSFAGLGMALASLGNNPTLKSASTTVGQYATAKCGA